MRALLDDLRRGDDRLVQILVPTAQDDRELNGLPGTLKSPLETFRGSRAKPRFPPSRAVEAACHRLPG